jgi:hypothetical protein
MDWPRWEYAADFLSVNALPDADVHPAIDKLPAMDFLPPPLEASVHMSGCVFCLARSTAA